MSTTWDQLHISWDDYLKCAAYCPNWLANEEVRQVDEFKEYIEEIDPEWDLKAECYSYYDSMKSCLVDCPRVPPENGAA